MKSASLRFAVAGLLWASSGVLLADRVVEDRKTATHVVIGTVQGVYAEESQYYRGFIVEIALEKVDKGDGLTVGHLLYTSCYQRKEGVEASLDADSAGHTTVPKPGEKIRAFLSHHRGRYEGIYPDWVDILNPRPRQLKAERVLNEMSLLS